MENLKDMTLNELTNHILALEVKIESASKRYDWRAYDDNFRHLTEANLERRLRGTDTNRAA